MNIKMTSLSLLIILMAIFGLASAKPKNATSYWMPCFALLEYDSQGNPVGKEIKPAYVTEKEWVEFIKVLIKKELAKKNLNTKSFPQTSRAEKKQTASKTASSKPLAYSSLHDITYDIATGFWHIGRGLFYLSYEIGKGFVFISIQAGKHVIIPLSKASLYYVWQTIKSLAHYSITPIPQEEDPTDIMPPLEPQTEYPLNQLPAIEANSEPSLLAIEYNQK